MRTEFGWRMQMYCRRMRADKNMATADLNQGLTRDLDEVAKDSLPSLQSCAAGHLKRPRLSCGWSLRYTLPMW
jgi:hypothetical protein